MGAATTAKCENCDFEVEASPVRVFALGHIKRTGHVVKVAAKRTGHVFKVAEAIEVPD